MTEPNLRLLLISNSTIHGGAYLGHVLAPLKAALAGVSHALFVPYALKDHDAYTAKARAVFSSLGVRLDSAHEAADPAVAAGRAEAIFVGGGNTFRLLKAMQVTGLLEAIRERCRAGTLYIGSSAGSNVAAPTIRTTNDMPIVQPASFDALGLVPFQINPHYLDPDPASKHMGETREERLVQYLEENETPVVGLREGAWLRVASGSVLLEGTTGARVFRRGRPAVERHPGDLLDDLV